MCGIIGIVGPGGPEERRNKITDCLSLLEERGPDHQGVWIEGNVGLGHTRLSIIDLDPRSNQPFLVEDLIALTYNGEIYNFQALKRELERLGHSFSTTSDTEVLAKGYLEWGASVVNRLDGMFAFALFDRRENSLLLGRDPFGQKPLYVYQENNELVFSSDIRVIRHLKGSELTIDLFALDYYLTELSTPQPHSIWKQIKQVAPASYRKISLDNFRWSEQTYWTLPTQTTIHHERTALEIVEEKLARAIKKRTIADVPIGCFLSGGVDSGLVVSLLAEQTDTPVKTFTVGMSGYEMDESALARIVAERHQTDHAELTVRPDIREITEQMISYCGEPFADSSLIPSYFVCKEIAKHVRVALSGDGGDEMFGGYKDYLKAFRADQFLRTHGSGRFADIRVLLDKVASRVHKRENLGSLQEYTRQSGAQRMFRHMGLTPADRENLWRPELRRGEHSTAEDFLEQKWSQHPSAWLSDRLMRASLGTRLVNDYLVKVDRTSMANSLEVRSPFLDRELAETAFQISPLLKFQGNQSKYLLKRIAQRKFDKNIFQRPKQGFGIPLNHWLRNELKSFTEDILLDRNAWIYGYFRYEAVESLWKWHLHSEGRTDSLWSLLCLELWARNLGRPH